MGTRFDIPKGTVDLLEGVVETGLETLTLTANEVALLGALHDASPSAVTPEELLTSALGYAATAKSRTVTVTIQRLRKKIEEDPAEPRTVVTVRGEGYALRYGAPPRSRSPAQTPITNAPAGRQDDLAALDRAFDRGAYPVVLVGPGGMGKTTLARWWAERENATWVELFGVTDGSALRRRVVASLDLERQPDADEAIRARFDSGVPIVLDNAEDLHEDGLAALASWLTGRGRILVTSQTPLGLPAEQCVVLGGLDRETARTVLHQARERAGLPALEDPIIEAVLARFGGLPLALVIAAPVADFLEETVQALDVPSDATARHHPTLSEGVGRTFSRLEPETLAVAAALAVFTGSASLQALGVVAGRPLPTILRALVTLRGCGVVVREDRNIDLIPMARTLLRYAPEHAEIRAAAQGRFIDWLLALVPSHRQLKAVRQDLEHALGLSQGVKRIRLLALHLEMLYSFGPAEDILPQARLWLAGLPASLAAEVEVESGWAMMLAGERTAGRDRIHAVIDDVTLPFTYVRGSAVLAMGLAWERLLLGIGFARKALGALEGLPFHVHVEVGTHAGYALCRLGEAEGFDVLDRAIALGTPELPTRALTASLSKARLIPASPGELDRCRALLDRVGDTLGRMQRAVDGADLAVILLDAGGDAEEAWALIQPAIDVLRSEPHHMLSTILANAAVRLVNQQKRSLELIGAVGPPVHADQIAFVTALTRQDRRALAGLPPDLRALGEAFLDRAPLPVDVGIWVETRAGLASVLERL